MTHPKTHTHSRLVGFLAAVGLAATMTLVPGSATAQAAYTGTHLARQDVLDQHLPELLRRLLGRVRPWVA